MQFASLVATSLLALMQGNAASNLSGTWVLDRAMSELGAGKAPRQFVIDVAQTDSRLDILTLTIDRKGQHVSYTECPLGRSFVVLPTSSHSTRVEEEWQLLPTGELTIVRVIRTRFHRIRQRLVLTRSTIVE